MSSKRTLNNGITIKFTKSSSLLPCGKGKLARINYTGKFENGIIFDSNILEKFGHV